MARTRSVSRREQEAAASDAGLETGDDSQVDLNDDFDYQTQEEDEAEEATSQVAANVAPFGRNGNLALVGHQSPAPNGRNLRGAIGRPSPAPTGLNLRGGRTQTRSARGASERDMQGIADAIFREVDGLRAHTDAKVQALEADVKRARTENQRLTREVAELRRLGQVGPGRTVAHTEAAIPLTRDQMQEKWKVGTDPWSWKAFKPTAEKVYRLMSAPFDNPSFVMMCDRGSAELDRAQPLAWRYKVITHDPMFRPYWAQVMNYVTKAQETIDVMGEIILGELAALYLVTNRGTDIVPLSSYLAMTRSDVSDVLALTESEIKTLKKPSVITAQALMEADGLTWPSTMPGDIRSGEAIRSVCHYQEELRKARMAEKAPASEQSVAPAGARPQRTEVTPVVQAVPVAPRVASAAKQTKPKEKSAGPATSNLCSRCVRSGHRSQECMYAAHVEYNPKAPYDLLSRVGRGELSITP
jgi:hypothetical protein